ncbi:hypothetical protein O181_003901 [Austropuccinia psidii MF-1]|uniref:Uncharacterized protein n=1 Tax=Austropuccinia psidii MF-1 TaxID=1389203 RepID=A0A9Q3GEJ3_9BASI|nr:hypothetical protein [Austropuccinia psidii MF-1]
MKLRKSRSFSGLLGGYPGISQGPRSRLGEEDDEEQEESVEEENSSETEVKAASAGSPESSENPNLALSNQHFVSQAEQTFLKMMKQMNQFTGQPTQEVSPKDNSRAPESKKPSMKAPDSFDVTQAHKLGIFI